MRIKGLKLVLVLVLSVGVLAVTLAALASDATTKSFVEGQAGKTAVVARPEALAARGVEGAAGDVSVGAVADIAASRPYEEGTAGSKGTLQGEGLDKVLAPEAPTAMSVVLEFSGVTDDGKKSASDRKEATSILCTNSGTANATIEVQLFQWSGAMVYTGTVTAVPKASYTFSTQNTTIYFDDIIFGSGGGTDSIFQGYGRVLSTRPTVICTAEVLDPLGYPPVYMSGLEMYRP